MRFTYNEDAPLLHAYPKSNRRKYMAIAFGVLVCVGAIYYYNNSSQEMGQEILLQEDFGPESTSHMTLTSTEIKQMLTATNIKRCMHGVGPLKWGDTLYKNTVATFDQQSQMKHSDCYNIPASQGGPAGENLYWAPPPKGPAGAVNAWYEEINNCGAFPGCVKGKKGTTGHFTALVWKSATTLACTRSKANAGLIACRYNAGPSSSGCQLPNMGGCYTSNVLAPVKSEAQCRSAAGISCDGKDRDNCLAKKWGSKYKCDSYAQGYCSSGNKKWKKQVRKCCPQLCCGA